MRKPDISALRAIGETFDQHRDAGTLTPATWDELLQKAVDAAGDHTELLEGLFTKAMLAGLLDD